MIATDNKVFRIWICLLGMWYEQNSLFFILYFFIFCSYCFVVVLIFFFFNSSCCCCCCFWCCCFATFVSVFVVALVLHPLLFLKGCEHIPRVHYLAHSINKPYALQLITITRSSWWWRWRERALIQYSPWHCVLKTWYLPRKNSYRNSPDLTSAHQGIRRWWWQEI